MGTVNINVYGRDYPIACDDGQEAHLGKLSQMVNKRVGELLEEMGRAPEYTMLIYTTLMLADELLDVTKAYKRLDDRLKEVEARAAASEDVITEEEVEVAVESAMAEQLELITDRIDKLADQLEQAA